MFAFLRRSIATLALASSSWTSAAIIQQGDFETFTQVAWGTPANDAALLLVANYASLYPIIFEVGIPGNAGFSMIFTTATAVITYLPPIDPIGQLVADLLNPTSSSAGFFGGEVVGLRLNVDFSRAGLLDHPTGIPFGDLVLQNLTGASAPLNGLAVHEFLADAEILLGGGVNPVPLLEIHLIAQALNGAFLTGEISPWAQVHLAIDGDHGGIEVHEPATFALLGISLLGLWASGWRAGGHRSRRLRAGCLSTRRGMQVA